MKELQNNQNIFLKTKNTNQMRVQQKQTGKANEKKIINWSVGTLDMVTLQNKNNTDVPQIT